MSAWSELPNAAHIDRVIASVKAHPKIWNATWDPVWDAARDAAWNAARWDAVRWDAVRWDAARWNAAWDAAVDAAVALIAYDDCAHYLDMSPEQLKAWAILSEKPAAALLLSAVIAFEQIGELEAA